MQDDPAAKTSAPTRASAHLRRCARFVARRLLKDSLWKLHQYPPRPLVLPSRYTQAPALSRAPKISIVTPSYNAVAFIEATIRSVLDQGYPDLEYICQDGASSDGTADIIRAYAPRLHAWSSEPDRGQTHAINKGFAQASGEILAYLNSDDLLLPGALHYIAAFFERNPAVDVVYGHRIMIDEEGNEVGRWVLPRHDDRTLKYADYIPQETMFWRRRIFEKVGGAFDESFAFAMDWDLILRFQAAGARFVRVPRFLGAFRVHAAQKTQSLIDDIGEQEMNRLRERVHGQVPSYFEMRRRLLPFMIRHTLMHHAYARGLVQI
jgi:glycosyltransferase involved in cell wall biosynthesis